MLWTFVLDDLRRHFAQEAAEPAGWSMCAADAVLSHSYQLVVRDSSKLPGILLVPLPSNLISLLSVILEMVSHCGIERVVRLWRTQQRLNT